MIGESILLVVLCICLVLVHVIPPFFLYITIKDRSIIGLLMAIFCCVILIGLDLYLLGW